MNTTTLETPATNLGQTLAGKYLTFRLGDESYGIGVLKISEIIQLGMLALPVHVRYR